MAVCDHVEGVPDGIDLIVTAHAVPDQSSVASRQSPARSDSGGGEGLSRPLPDLRRRLLAGGDTGRGRLLARVGVPIEEVNTVRTHLSAIKWGRLAAAAPEPTTTIVISGVLDGRVDLVASGPTVTCSTAPRDALEVLREENLTCRVPRRVVKALSYRPPPPAVVSRRVILPAEGKTAARAIADTVEEGLVVTIRPCGQAGETALWALGSTPPGPIGVFSGETTVEVTGGGRGGRNQEAALAAALAIEGQDVVFVSFGTDGVDGPADAAGVDGSTAECIRRAGIEPVEALAANDSYTALDAGGALIRTGPTGATLADIWLVDHRRDNSRTSRAQ